MDRRKFNKGNKGNKGGGAHTVKEHEWHVELWEGVKNVDGTLTPWDVAELEKKVASKKYTGRDMYALRVLKGDPMILKNLADKVLADLHDFRGKDGEKLEGAIMVPAAKNYDDTKQSTLASTSRPANDIS